MVAPHLSTREDTAITAFERLFLGRGLPDLTYPLHDRDALITASGPF